MKKITLFLLIGILSIFLNSSIFAQGKEANQLLNNTFVVVRNTNCTIDDNFTIKLPTTKIFIEIEGSSYLEYNYKAKDIIEEKIRELNPEIPENATFNLDSKISKIGNEKTNSRIIFNNFLEIKCGDKTIPKINLEDFFIMLNYDITPIFKIENIDLTASQLEELKYNIQQVNPKLQVEINPELSANVYYSEDNFEITKTIPKEELVFEFKIPEKFKVKDKNNLTEEEKELFFDKILELNNNFGTIIGEAGPRDRGYDEYSKIWRIGIEISNKQKNSIMKNSYFDFHQYFLKDKGKDDSYNVEELIKNKEFNNLVNDDDLIFFSGYSNIHGENIIININLDLETLNKILIDEKDLEKENFQEKIYGSAPNPEDLILKNDNRVKVLGYFKNDSEETKSEIEKNLEKIEEKIELNSAIEKMEINKEEKTPEKIEDKKEEIKYLEEFYFDKEVPEKIEEEIENSKNEIKMNNLKITRLPKTGPLEIFLIIFSLVFTFGIFKFRKEKLYKKFL